MGIYISKGISRAETLGMNLQFEHANSIGPAVSIPDRKMIKNYFPDIPIVIPQSISFHI